MAWIDIVNGEAASIVRTKINSLALSTTQTLSTATATLLGLSTPKNTVDYAFKKVYSKKLIQSYVTSGTFTFTAPDRNGDGSTYEIGVLIIGGGGSGGAAKCWDTGSNLTSATGGGSGYSQILTLTVTPGNTYSVVVGAGGTAVTTLTNTSNYINGITGGTSSFNGTSVLGGDGGSGSTNGLVSGVSGGQGSDGAPSFYIGASGLIKREYAPYGGITPIGTTSSDNTYLAKTYPMMCFNPFTNRLILGAGGGASGNSYRDDSSVQTASYVFADGGKSGTGKSTWNVASNQTASVATSYGCGGGGIAFCGNSANTVNTATSGRGADGAVLIYA